MIALLFIHSTFQLASCWPQNNAIYHPNNSSNLNKQSQNEMKNWHKKNKRKQNQLSFFNSSHSKAWFVFDLFQHDYHANLLHAIIIL